MQFRELEWKDSISDGVIVASNCVVKVYGYDIKIEFYISHELNENKYCLHSFGKGHIRQLQPRLFATVDEAKSFAYEIYNDEMIRMKRAIDSFLKEETK